MELASPHALPAERQPCMLALDARLEGPLSGDRALCEDIGDIRDECCARWRAVAKPRRNVKAGKQPYVLHGLTQRFERVKLLQFWEDVRPPLWGTHTRTSRAIRARNPCEAWVAGEGKAGGGRREGREWIKGR